MSFYSHICFGSQTTNLSIPALLPSQGFIRQYCSFPDCALGRHLAPLDFCSHIPLCREHLGLVSLTFLLRHLHLDSFLACSIHLRAPPFLPLLVLLHNPHDHHQDYDNDYEPILTNQANSNGNLAHLHAEGMPFHSCFNQYAITPTLLDIASPPRIGDRSCAFCSAADLKRCSASYAVDFPLTFLYNWCCSLLGVVCSFFRSPPFTLCLKLVHLIDCFVYRQNLLHQDESLASTCVHSSFHVYSSPFWLYCAHFHFSGLSCRCFGNQAGLKTPLVKPEKLQAEYWFHLFVFYHNLILNFYPSSIKFLCSFFNLDL